LTRKSCRAEIRVKAPAAGAAIYSALSPDISKLSEKGERLALSRKGSAIVFTIETDDLASLRANVNSYLRLVDMSHRCISL
jgi:tRNA threonylcarbamoyladenosine modification (KEOPS) complex  Pcc1 subunit